MGNLNKVVYTDHQTVITADNLNAIQDSVIQNTSYTTCATGASTAAKTAALTNFVLTTGSAVKVKFTNTNTASNPTLNVNSTGAKPIMQYGTTVAGTTATESWDDGAVVEFVYDGTNWVMQGRNTIDAVSKANGGTFSGNVQIDRAGGTTSQTGTSDVIIGNNKGYLTEGNSRGALTLYSPQTYYTDIMSANTQTAHRTINFPNASGTVALTDNPTNIAIRNTDGVANQDNLVALTLGNSTPRSQAGHSEGFIASYGNNGYYTAIQANDATANRQIKFPDESGTLMTNQGGTFSGNVVLNRAVGTTSAVGWSVLTLGNSTPSGTSGNSMGDIAIYGETGNYIEIYPAWGGPTANRSIKIPDANGTIALVGTNSAYYTPTITAGTGFAYDNVNAIYKITSDFLFISGRFRVTDHGTTNSSINLTYPSGVTTVAGVGAFGHVHINNSVNASALSIRPANDGKSCFIQSGAGNITVSQLVPNGDYVVFQAMIPLR